MIVFVLLNACSQTSSQSGQVMRDNSVVQTTSPSATIPGNQTSSSPQNANNFTTTNDDIAPSEVDKKGKIQRVQFARGRNSATFEDVVYQNYNNEYLVSARARQQMTVSLQVQKNPKSYFSDTDAVFEIIKVGDSNSIAKPQGNSWQGRLPKNGEYTIRVTTFTHYTDYKLKITIK